MHCVFMFALFNQVCTIASLYLLPFVVNKRWIYNTRILNRAVAIPFSNFAHLAFSCLKKGEGRNCNADRHMQPEKGLVRRYKYNEYEKAVKLLKWVYETLTPCCMQRVKYKMQNSEKFLCQTAWWCSATQNNGQTRLRRLLRDANCPTTWRPLTDWRHGHYKKTACSTVHWGQKKQSDS